mmetsp:Transcript_105256/g.202165  ORF Transcript_105256/g.202165 Transcript_105256/m.202165 type:complete len:513 (-) Transcript_105256:118-1656(-)
MAPASPLRPGPMESRVPAANQGEGNGAKNLEEYAHNLEMKLTMKSGLLEEAVQFHQSLENRLAMLEQGLSWKDAQLEEIVRQNEEACHRSAAWQRRAEHLEEENCVLRDALLEHADKNDQLQQLLEVQARQHSTSPKVTVGASGDVGRSGGAGDAAAGDAAEAHQAHVQRLEQKLKESNQKMLLLEEQLRIRSGSDYLGRDTFGELGALPELGLLAPADAWAAVGRGAADRICGAVPHIVSGVQMKHRPSLGSLRALGTCRPSYAEVEDEVRELADRSWAQHPTPAASMPAHPALMTPPASAATATVGRSGGVHPVTVPADTAAGRAPGPVDPSLYGPMGEGFAQQHSAPDAGGGGQVAWKWREGVMQPGGATWTGVVSQHQLPQSQLEVHEKRGWSPAQVGRPSIGTTQVSTSVPTPGPPVHFLQAPPATATWTVQHSPVPQQRANPSPLPMPGPPRSTPPQSSSNAATTTAGTSGAWTGPEQQQQQQPQPQPQPYPTALLARSSSQQAFR